MTSTIRQFDVGREILGRSTSTGTTVNGYHNPNEYTPAIDQGFHLDASNPAFLDLLLWYMTPAKPDPLYIFGPSGCGKTSLTKQLAARVNYPVYEITGHSRLEFPELVGQWVVNATGGMTYAYGPLAHAMKAGGIFLLNEIDLLDPATAAGLNSVLDGSPLCIPENGGEIVRPNAMFRFVATANTRGSSDDTGLYHGTLRQNLALMDRFQFVEVNYPAPDVERLILDSRYSDSLVPADLKHSMIVLAGEIRAAFQQGSISVTMTTRSLLRWCGLLLQARTYKINNSESALSYSFKRALTFRADPDTGVFLHEMLQRVFRRTDTDITDATTTAATTTKKKGR